MSTAARSGAKPKAGGKLGGKSAAKSGWKPRIRDINDDPVRAAPATPPTRASLKIIPGGKSG